MTKLIMTVLAFTAAVILLGAGGFSSGEGRFAREFLKNFEKITKTPDFLREAGKGSLSAGGAVKVPILVYHGVAPEYDGETDLVKRYTVTPAALAQELQYLKDNKYTAVTFRQLIDYFSNDSPLPAKPVIITFDDAWHNQYVYALPILKKMGFPATFFVFTNAMGHKHFLTWEEVADLEKAGMTIGGHTKSHPYLFKITDKTKLREEIIDSKKILEDRLGKRIYVFAYPFGHYNDEILSVVKEGGYEAARSSYEGTYQTRGGLFTLRSTEVTSDFNKFVEALNK